MATSSQDAAVHDRPHSDSGSHDLPRDMLFPALRTDPESFPVLKAFQDYIEEERERARRRIVTISAVAILSLVLVVAGFLVAGSILFGSMARRNDQLQETVLRVAVRDLPAQALPVPGPQAPPPAELLRLGEALQRLEAENSAMRRQVNALQDLPTSLAASIETAVSNLAARTPATVAPAAERPAAALPPPPAAAPFGPPTVMAPRASDPAAAPARGDAPPREPTPPPLLPPEQTAVASHPNARVSIRVPSRVAEAPRIEGFVPSSLTLVTDRGVAIPWRIVVPE